MFFGCSDGMEREACVCDHGYERSDLCAEIIIIITYIHTYIHTYIEVFVISIIDPPSGGSMRVA